MGVDQLRQLSFKLWQIRIGTRAGDKFSHATQTARKLKINTGFRLAQSLENNVVPKRR